MVASKTPSRKLSHEQLCREQYWKASAIIAAAGGAAPAARLRIGRHKSSEGWILPQIPIKLKHMGANYMFYLY
ncbi:hypothetical protein BDZ94DRAFT_1269368 [Collybia nuda]|uniref:Uncharacterized protein n=1 Tax=Collybia nuda TaxID=64659 RepID=A0A9P5XYC1_9AGAR|nr:hypothetical protein BDZ94DRAFT_1269368 [Collybia nuda]